MVAVAYILLLGGVSYLLWLLWFASSALLLGQNGLGYVTGVPYKSLLLWCASSGLVCVTDYPTGLNDAILKLVFSCFVVLFFLEHTRPSPGVLVTAAGYASPTLQRIMDVASPPAGFLACCGMVALPMSYGTSWWRLLGGITISLVIVWVPKVSCSCKSKVSQIMWLSVIPPLLSGWSIWHNGGATGWIAIGLCICSMIVGLV